MDKLSVGGVILAFLAVLGGNFLEGGSFMSLLNLPAFLIVFGGTLGACMLQTPMTVFVLAMKRMKDVFNPTLPNFEEGIKKITVWGDLARKEGLLALQDAASEEKEPFVKSALELLIDGSRPEDVRHVMEQKIGTIEELEHNVVKVFEALGGYCPTVGIIGAVMGLINVMSHLDQPEHLGHGIAVAFVATIYGVMFANVIFLPMGNKLKFNASEDVRYREMMLEGVIAVAAGEASIFIEAKMKSFLETFDSENPEELEDDEADNAQPQEEPA